MIIYTCNIGVMGVVIRMILFLHHKALHLFFYSSKFKIKVFLTFIKRKEFIEKHFIIGL